MLRKESKYHFPCLSCGPSLSGVFSLGSCLSSSCDSTGVLASVSVMLCAKKSPFAGSGIQPGCRIRIEKEQKETDVGSRVIRDGLHPTAKYISMFSRRERFNSMAVRTDPNLPVPLWSVETRLSFFIVFFFLSRPSSRPPQPEALCRSGLA